MNNYLISSESYRLIDKEIKKIVKNNDYFVMNLNKVTLEDIIKEANYFSFDNNIKYIVVSNASTFGTAKITDKDNDLLVSYLNKPNPNTVIIFTTLNGIDLRKKITKMIKDKYTLINILPFNYQEKDDAITNYVKENGFTIDTNAKQYILNNTSSLDMIYNELDKVFLYYNSKINIKLEDVKKIVGSLIDNNNFHFVNAVIVKNLQESLKLYNNLKVYKVESLALINLLAREYRLMYYLKRYQSKKLQIREISKKLSLQDWQVNKLYQNSLAYTEEELLSNIKKLANVDIGIKTGALDKDVALISFLVDVCA